MAEQQETSKIGLACAGGVVVGAVYEIGALCALDEAIEGVSFNALDVYVGVSSGALISACLANGVTPHTLSRAIIDAAAPEININPALLFAPALDEYARRIKRVPGALWDAFNKYLQHPGDLNLLGSLAGLGSLVPVGLFSNEKLEAHLRNLLATEGRTNDFRELDRLLRIVAVELDTAAITTFGDEETADVPISKAVQASTALPGLYCPVEINGKSYIDGVARRTVHASVGLEAGAKLLFCINPIVPVNTQSEDVTAPAGPNLVDYGLPTVLSQTFRTIVYSRRSVGFKKYEHVYPGTDIILIEPDFNDYPMFFSNIFSFSNRQAVCEHAYATTMQYLRDHAERLTPVIASHGLRLRTEVITDESRRLYEATPASSGSTARQAQATLDRLDALLSQLDATPPADS